MRLTLGQLKQIIKEEVNKASGKSNYTFDGTDASSLDKEAQREVIKFLEQKKVKPGKVQVKLGTNGQIKIFTADKRIFTVDIKYMKDDPRQKKGSSSEEPKNSLAAKNKNI
jgi:hypothetical protein